MAVVHIQEFVFLFQSKDSNVTRGRFIIVAVLCRGKHYSYYLTSQNSRVRLFDWQQQTY